MRIDRPAKTLKTATSEECHKKYGGILQKMLTAAIP